MIVPAIFLRFLITPQENCPTGIDPTGSLCIHTLRKCCIQNWANEINNPEVVRVLAGHANLKTTMRYYCQVDAGQRAKAAAAIDDLLKQTDARLTPEANLGKNYGRSGL